MSSVLRWSLVALVATLCLCEETSAPWPQSQLIEPSVLAKALDSTDPPFVVCVSDAAPYRLRHISQAIFAGPAGKPEGLDLLKTAASVIPKDASIVIYCGCCPLNKCPNVRPAFMALKEMGFSHVRVLDVMTNMQMDWYRPGYPSEGEKK